MRSLSNYILINENFKYSSSKIVSHFWILFYLFPNHALGGGEGYVRF